MSAFRVCAGCQDWIWPTEEVFNDDGRSPLCAVCHVKEATCAHTAELVSDVAPTRVVLP